MARPVSGRGPLKSGLHWTNDTLSAVLVIPRDSNKLYFLVRRLAGEPNSQRYVRHTAWENRNPSAFPFRATTITTGGRCKSILLVLSRTYPAANHRSKLCRAADDSGHIQPQTRTREILPVFPLHTSACRYAPPHPGP